MAYHNGPSGMMLDPVSPRSDSVNVERIHPFTDANPYKYCANNPTRNLDPSGLDWFDCLAECVEKWRIPWQIPAASYLAGPRVPKGLVYPGQAATESIWVKICSRAGWGRYMKPVRFLGRASAYLLIAEGFWDIYITQSCFAYCNARVATGQERIWHW